MIKRFFRLRFQLFFLRKICFEVFFTFVYWLRVMEHKNIFAGIAAEMSFFGIFFRFSRHRHGTLVLLITTTHDDDDALPSPDKHPRNLPKTEETETQNKNKQIAVKPQHIEECLCRKFVMEKHFSPFCVTSSTI